MKFLKIRKFLSFSLQSNFNLPLKIQNSNIDSERSVGYIDFQMNFCSLCNHIFE